MIFLAYSLEATDEFLKGLEKLDKPLRERVQKILEKLKETPALSKPLKGKWAHYRIRFEGYRLLYTIIEHEKKVILVDVGKRDAVYKKYRTE